MVGVWEGLNLGSIPNFFLCFGMHPKIIEVHPKLIPKGGVVQYCQGIGVGQKCKPSPCAALQCVADHNAFSVQDSSAVYNIQNCNPRPAHS